MNLNVTLTRNCSIHMFHSYPLGSSGRKDTDGNTTQQPAVFLSVHNAGANHQEWLRFVNHPAMAPIKSSSTFIHIDVPGQEANAELLDLGKDAAGKDKKFPSMQVSYCCINPY